MPRYHSSLTYAPRMCIWCRRTFSPTRWDQSYCDNLCSRHCNDAFPVTSFVLEYAQTLIRQRLLCWNCNEIEYPMIYPMMLRPYELYDGKRPTCTDIVALCVACKPGIRVMISIGALQ